MPPDSLDIGAFKPQFYSIQPAYSQANALLLQKLLKTLNSGITNKIFLKKKNDSEQCHMSSLFICSLAEQVDRRLIPNSRLKHTVRLLNFVSKSYTVHTIKQFFPKFLTQLTQQSFKVFIRQSSYVIKHIIFNFCL